MSKPGTKSLRDQPELYSEKKADTCLSLTKTAVGLLDEAAKSLDLSRSELVEQVALRLFRCRQKRLRQAARKTSLATIPEPLTVLMVSSPMV